MAIAIAAASLLRMVIEYVRAKRLGSPLKATQRALALDRLEAALAAPIEAQQDSDEVSWQLAGEFFTGLERDGS